MPSRPLNSTHGQTTLGVACHHHLWAAQTVGRRRAWHSIVARGRQISRMTSSVECHHLLWACHAIISFRQHRQSDDVGRGMPSPPLDSTYGQMTLGVACHHRPSTAHTVGLRRVWHDITAFGQHTRSNDVRSGMPSSPLGSTHGRMTSAWHAIIAHEWKTRSNDVGHKMPSSP